MSETRRYKINESMRRELVEVMTGEYHLLNREQKILALESSSLTKLADYLRFKGKLEVIWQEELSMHGWWRIIDLAEALVKYATEKDRFITQINNILKRRKSVWKYHDDEIQLVYEGKAWTPDEILATIRHEKNHQNLVEISWEMGDEGWRPTFKHRDNPQEIIPKLNGAIYRGFHNKPTYSPSWQMGVFALFEDVFYFSFLTNPEQRVSFFEFVRKQEEHELLISSRSFLRPMLYFG